MPGRRRLAGRRLWPWPDRRPPGRSRAGPRWCRRHRTWPPPRYPPRARSTRGVAIAGEPGEGAQVGQALAALDPPVVLPADRRGKADHEGLVEVLVGVAEHAAEQPVDLICRDRGERQPADQEDVADRVEREVHTEHPAAAFEQVPVELGVVLIRMAAEERLDVEAVRVGDKP